MRHFGFRTRGRRKPSVFKNATMHVPASMDNVITTNDGLLVVAQSPSLFAGGSASNNIEASDRDRTVNVGNHMGQLIINITVRNSTATGILEFVVFRVERAFSTPVIGTDPIPSDTDSSTQGVQQAYRMALPGRVIHFSTLAYTAETTRVKLIKVRPAKYGMSKVRPGDHICIVTHNRGSGSVTVDYQMRYKESQ